jgi:hypothetical protein
VRRQAAAVAVLVACVAAALAGCGAARHPAQTVTIPGALIAQRRVIGVGPRFLTRARGPVIGPCRRGLGTRRGVHVEVFAANRVVLIPAGIGARPPLRHSEGRISGARCFGELVTVDPTGIVLLRPGARQTVAALFRSWGQPLSRTRMMSFRAAHGAHVTAYVGGRLWHGAPGAVPLTVHAEIVLEIGPHVPPHHAFTFPPGL